MWTAALAFAIVFPVADGTVIQPYTNKWKLSGVPVNGPDTDVKELGTWSDDVKIVELGGRKIVRRRQVWNYGSGTESYLNVFDPQTMRPILTDYTNTPGHYYRFEYGKDAVRYQRTTGDPDLTKPMQQGVVKPSQPMYDFNGGMFGLLAVGFPLAEGYSTKIPVFRIWDPSPKPAWVELHVTGREEVAAGPGKKVNAWVVRADSPATEEVMFFWLVKEPPYIIRLKQEWQGRMWTFEMV